MKTIEIVCRIVIRSPLRCNLLLIQNEIYPLVSSELPPFASETMLMIMIIMMLMMNDAYDANDEGDDDDEDNDVDDDSAILQSGG